MTQPTLHHSAAVNDLLIVEDEDDEDDDFQGFQSSSSTAHAQTSVASSHPPQSISLLDSPKREHAAPAPAPVAPPAAPIQQQPMTSPTKASAYDASKLSIFDEMVETDLAAMNEDWDDFAGPSNNNNNPPAIADPRPEAAAPQLNPFDEFSDFLESSENNNNSHNNDNLLSFATQDHEEPSHPTTEGEQHGLAQLRSAESLLIEQQEEDFGDFESHDALPAPLVRAHSIHRSDEVVDLHQYYRENKHPLNLSLDADNRPTLCSSGDTTPTSGKVGSVTSEFSVKHGVFIEDTIHRSSEIVDFNALRSTPEPVLVHHTHGHQHAPTSSSHHGSSGRSENDSGKTIMSYSSMVDEAFSPLDESMNNHDNNNAFDSGSTSAKYDISQDTSTKEYSSDRSLSTSEFFSAVPSEKVPAFIGGKSEDDGDDPFAGLEPALAPPAHPAHATHVEEDDDWDEFQDCQPAAGTTSEEPQEDAEAAQLARSLSFQIEQKALAVEQQQQPHQSHGSGNLLDIADLLDFSSMEAVPATSSSHPQPPQQQSQEIDLLSMDFLSAPVPAAHATTSTAFPAPAPAQHDGLFFETTFETSFDAFSSPPSAQSVSAKQQQEELDEFDGDEEFTSFASAEPVASQPHPPHPHQHQAQEPVEDLFAAQTTVSTSSSSVPAAPAPAPVKALEKAVSKPAAATVSVEDKPLTLQNLEVLAVLLGEKHFYEAAYNCHFQTLLLRQINDLTEKKRVAMDNDDLELAVQCKNQTKELASRLRSHEVERQWQLLSTDSHGKRALSVQEYFQRIQKSIQSLTTSSSSSSSSSSSFSSFFSSQSAPPSSSSASSAASQALYKSLAVRLQATYFDKGVGPDKATPMEHAMRYYALTKRSLKIVDFLLAAPATYELYTKIYAELLGLVAPALGQVAQTLTAYQSLHGKVSVQLEIKLHPRMQKFLAEAAALLENAIYLAVVCQEVLLFDRPPFGQVDGHHRQHQSTASANQALRLFSQAQDLLLVLADQFDMPSPVIPPPLLTNPSSSLFFSLPLSLSLW